MGGMMLVPIESKTGAIAGVIVTGSGNGLYTAAAIAFPKAPDGSVKSLGAFLDDHAHAVIVEDVPMAKARRLAEAWAKKFRKGLVLAPCKCEDMVETVAKHEVAWSPSHEALWAQETPLLGPAPSLSERIARVGGGPRPWCAPVTAEDSLLAVAEIGRVYGPPPAAVHEIVDGPAAARLPLSQRPPRRFRFPASGRKALLCRRCYKTVIGAHKCSHGNACRPCPKTLASDPDRPECSYCDDERVDACGFTPTGPGP